MAISRNDNLLAADEHLRGQMIFKPLIPQEIIGLLDDTGVPHVKAAFDLFQAIRYQRIVSAYESNMALHGSSEKMEENVAMWLRTLPAKDHPGNWNGQEPNCVEEIKDWLLNRQAVALKIRSCKIS
jgi:hypothetical protein